VPAVEGATAAAIAVLDAVMPHVIAGAEVNPVSVVLEAARALYNSLCGLGVGGTGPAEAARRVAAESARWASGGRGIVIRRTRWVRR
jgi:hypothetical protein